MRILLLTQWFDPEPTLKGLVFAHELQALGHEVEVITGFPNYPGGKLYTGYRQRLLSREVIKGVPVARVPLYPSHDSSAIGRLLNYVSFMVTSCIVGIFNTKKPDVIYVYHPPITAGLSAAVIGFFRRTPFVIDVQDLWPDTLRSTGMIKAPLLLRLAGSVCRWTYRRAAHVVVLSTGFRNILVKRGISEHRLSIIHNWCDEQALALRPVTPVDTSYMDGRFAIVFAGNMGKAQAMQAVIRAAELAFRANPSVLVVLVGAGVHVESLNALVTELGVPNVHFVPRMPMSEIGSVLDRADALLVHLKDDPLFSITIPSKTQAYLAAGKPILMGVRGDAADMVRRASAGVVVDSEDAQAIADGMLQLAAMSEEERREMGNSGARFYREHLSIRQGTERFADIFARVARRAVR